MLTLLGHADNGVWQGSPFAQFLIGISKPQLRAVRAQPADGASNQGQSI